MLPDVDSEYGVLAVHKRAILISGAYHLQLPCIIQHQPGPTASESLAPASLIFSLSPSNPPNVALMASPSAPDGAAGPPGFMISQNNV